MDNFCHQLTVMDTYDMFHIRDGNPKDGYLYLMPFRMYELRIFTGGDDDGHQL